MSFQFAQTFDSRGAGQSQQYLPPQADLSVPVIHVRAAGGPASSSPRSGMSGNNGFETPTSSKALILLEQLGLMLSASVPRTPRSVDGAVHPDDGATASDQVVERLSEALQAAEYSKAPFASLYADTIRLALVARMLGLQSASAGEPDRPSGRGRSPLQKWRLKRVAEYIESHLDEAITLADMAAVAGLSRMHFAAQFRSATGTRPHEFLLQRRIDRAKQMLAETETSLVEVALTVGFQTQSHFTTIFKRFVGETPRRWRSLNCERAADDLPATPGRRPLIDLDQPRLRDR